jgi:hypothetical protein
MLTFLKRKSIDSTRFSEFIRTASSAEKKRIYTKVMKKASELQNAVLSRHARPAKEL